MLKELAAAGLPNLWIPAADSFFEVDEIPVLGTGKLDLQALKRAGHGPRGRRLGGQLARGRPASSRHRC